MKSSGTGFSDDTRRVLAAAGLSEAEIVGAAGLAAGVIEQARVRTAQ